MNAWQRFQLERRTLQLTGGWFFGYSDRSTEHYLPADIAGAVWEQQGKCAIYIYIYNSDFLCGGLACFPWFHGALYE